MRLWTIHPKYLDRKGLIDLWRDCIKILIILCDPKGEIPKEMDIFKDEEGKVSLEHFKSYLLWIWEEANTRGYKFDQAIACDAIFGIRLIEIPTKQVQTDIDRFYLEAGARGLEPYHNSVTPEIIVPHPIFEIKSEK